MISYYKLMYPTVGTKENQTSIKIDKQHIKKTVPFADKTQVFHYGKRCTLSDQTALIFDSNQMPSHTQVMNTSGKRKSQSCAG